MTVIESTSLNAETASSKLIPCLRRFNAALVGFHSNRTDHPYGTSELSVPVSMPAERGQKQLVARSGLLHRDRAVPSAVAAASLLTLRHALQRSGDPLLRTTLTS